MLKAAEAAAEQLHTGVVIALVVTMNDGQSGPMDLLGDNVLMSFLRVGEAEGLERLFTAAGHSWWALISQQAVSTALSRMMEAPEAARDGMYATLVGKLSAYMGHLRMTLVDVEYDMTTALKSAACTPAAALSLIQAGGWYESDTAMIMMEKAERSDDWLPVLKAITLTIGDYFDAKVTLALLRNARSTGVAKLLLETMSVSDTAAVREVASTISNTEVKAEMEAWHAAWETLTE